MYTHAERELQSWSSMKKNEWIKNIQNIYNGTVHQAHAIYDMKSKAELKTCKETAMQL